MMTLVHDTIEYYENTLLTRYNVASVDDFMIRIRMLWFIMICAYNPRFQTQLSLQI